MKAPNLDKQMKRAINPLEFIHIATKLGACDAKYLETGGQFKNRNYSLISQWDNIGCSLLVTWGDVQLKFMSANLI